MHLARKRSDRTCTGKPLHECPSLPFFAAQRVLLQQPRLLMRTPRAQVTVLTFDKT